MINQKEIYNDLNEIKASLRVVKNGENKFQKYKYFKLSDLLNALIPKLQEKEIFYSFQNEYIGNDVFKGIHTFTKNDNSISFTYSFPLDTAQGNRIQAYGSTMTYAERYGLQMIFSITDDKDDPDQNDLDKTAKPTKAELDKLNTAFENFGLTERADKVGFIKNNVGKNSSADLNKNDVQELLRLLKWITDKRDI